MPKKLNINPELKSATRKIKQAAAGEIAKLKRATNKHVTKPVKQKSGVVKRKFAAFKKTK